MKKITIEVDEDLIKALNNALAVFNRELFAMWIGCDSWLGDNLKKTYPEMSFSELTDYVMGHHKLLKEFFTKLEADFKEEV